MTSQPGSPSEPSNEVEAASPDPGTVLPYEDFVAPEPLATEPPTSARWVAFASILVGGLLGGMIGFGTSDLLGFPRWASALIALLFAAGGAAGVGIVAQLTLRAMNEWKPVQHPEDRR